jgi:hypothetical protein
MTLKTLMDIYDDLVKPRYRIKDLGAMDDFQNALDEESSLMIPSYMTKSGKVETIFIT